MRVTYLGGIDGWIDDGIAFTRPWGFDLAGVTTPTSIWFGEHDVLGPKAHARYLLAAIPAARSFQLPGGHLLGADDLAAIYNWLHPGTTPEPSSAGK